MRILLTNDDGIHAVGIRDFFTALTAAGHEVHVVAPISEQSAVGHAITIAMPLRVKEFRGKRLPWPGTVTGTPDDCVKLALTTLLPEHARRGGAPALSTPAPTWAWIYSIPATVSAATEGALMGYPAWPSRPTIFAPVSHGARRTLRASFTQWRPLGGGAAALRFEPQFSRPGPVAETLGLRTLPRPTPDPCSRIGTSPAGSARPRLLLADRRHPPEALAPETDRALLSAGYITLSPCASILRIAPPSRLDERLGGGAAKKRDTVTLLRYGNEPVAVIATGPGPRAPGPAPRRRCRRGWTIVGAQDLPGAA